MARVIGLTGGLGSGKSTVAAMLRALGAVVLDADAIVRDLQQPGTETFGEIVAAFGLTVVSPDGRLDRRALAGLVFRDHTMRARLNAIVHPRVRARIHGELEHLHQGLPQNAIVILDIPLLLDTAPRDAFPLAGIIVVDADEGTRVDRLVGSGVLTAEEARTRMAAQRPLVDKVAEADWVIDNRGDFEETRRQVERLWETLIGPSLPSQSRPRPREVP